MPSTVMIRGAGDLASGVAIRLWRAGLNVVMTELPDPLAVRRTVAFAEVVYAGRLEIEGVVGRRVEDPEDTLRILSVLGAHHVPVLIDPDCVSAARLHPLVIVDGRMTKQQPEALRHTAMMYIGLGPGFTAPANCHAVIETERGHYLGRVIVDGTSRPDSTRPDGDPRRVLRAPVEGLFESRARIGQYLNAGEEIGSVDGRAIQAPFSGVLRGLLRPGLRVHKGMKVGDLDTRDDPLICHLVSDKSLAIGGGVLEAMLRRPEVRSKLWG